MDSCGDAEVVKKDHRRGHVKTFQPADSATRANTSPAVIARSATVTVAPLVGHVHAPSGFVVGLHDHGVISGAGYERGKDKILSRPAV